MNNFEGRNQDKGGYSLSRGRRNKVDPIKKPYYTVGDLNCLRFLGVVTEAHRRRVHESSKQSLYQRYFLSIFSSRIHTLSSNHTSRIRGSCDFAQGDNKVRFYILLTD